MGNNCTMTIDGTDFRITQQGAAERGNAFASHKYAGKLVLRYELGLTFLRGIWSGSRDLTLQVSTTTSKYSTVFYATTLSRASAWRRITDMSGTQIKLNVYTTPATLRKTLQYRLV
jgi:hypothetical protein